MTWVYMWWRDGSRNPFGGLPTSTPSLHVVSFQRAPVLAFPFPQEATFHSCSYSWNGMYIFLGPSSRSAWGNNENSPKQVSVMVTPPYTATHGCSMFATEVLPPRLPKPQEVGWVLGGQCWTQVLWISEGSSGVLYVCVQAFCWGDLVAH